METTMMAHPTLSAAQIAGMVDQHKGVLAWQAGVDLLLDSPALAWKAGGVVDHQGRVWLDDDHPEWSSGERLLWDLARSLLTPHSGYTVDVGRLVDKVDDANLKVAVRAIERAAGLHIAHQRWWEQDEGPGTGRARTPDTVTP